MDLLVYCVSSKTLIISELASQFKFERF